jgi:hypothetical protein
MGNLSILRGALASAQVSAYTTGTITLPSAKGTFVEQTAFQSIASTTLTSNQSTITFGSIPSTFTHLQVRGIIFSNNTVGDPTFATVPTLTGTTKKMVMYAEGANSLGSATDSNVRYLNYASNIHNVRPAALLMDILDYSDADKRNVVRWIFGMATDAPSGANLTSVSSGNAGVLSEISFTWGPGLGAGTQLSLYGIKADL